MLILLAPLLAHAEPLPAPLPTALLPTPRELAAQSGGCTLVAELLVGLAEVASGQVVTGPGSLSQSGWQCLGVDNATLDVASRCPYSAMVHREPRR